MSAATFMILANYRALADRFAHRQWLMYQRSRFLRASLITKSARKRALDESKIKRNVRIGAAFGVLMGLFFVVVELGALVSGHVI